MLGITSSLLLNDVVLSGAVMTLELLQFHACPDRRKKRLKMDKEIIIGNTQVPVQQKQELLLHKVDFGDGKSEAFVALD